MTKTFFEAKETMKLLFTGQRYSDAVEILRKIASGELTYIQMVTEAKCFFDKYLTED